MLIQVLDRKIDIVTAWITSCDQIFAQLTNFARVRLYCKILYPEHKAKAGTISIMLLNEVHSF